MKRTRELPAASGHIVIGVDTHKHLHVAAAIDTIAGSLGTVTVPNDSGGFAHLVGWATRLGQVVAFGVEGTGFYGQPLARFLRERGARVVEVNRPDRAARRRKGKSDAVDAENAARAVLAGFADAEPKDADGSAECIRLLKVAYDGAVRQRTQAMNAIKSLLVVTDERLRTSCAGLNGVALVEQLSRLRPGGAADPDRAARYALRSLARRWKALDTEADDLADQIAALAQTAAPQLLQLYGIGPDSAAVILAAVGGNAARIHSEAALAKLAGVCPDPGRLRQDRWSSPPQPRRQSRPQRRHPPGRPHPHPSPSPLPRLRPATNHRRQDQTRNHPMLEALPSTAAEVRDLMTAGGRLVAGSGIGGLGRCGRISILTSGYGSLRDGRRG